MIIHGSVVNVYKYLLSSTIKNISAFPTRTTLKNVAIFLLFLENFLPCMVTAGLPGKVNAASATNQASNSKKGKFNFFLSVSENYNISYSHQKQSYNGNRAAYECR